MWFSGISQKCPIGIDHREGIMVDSLCSFLNSEASSTTLSSQQDPGKGGW